MLPLTSETWISDQWYRATWVPEDAPRIGEAFRALRGHAERWPTQRAFVDALPVRNHPIGLERKLTDEERAAGREAMERIKGLIKPGLGGRGGE